MNLMNRVAGWTLRKWYAENEDPLCILCHRPSTIGTTLLWQDEWKVRRGVVQPEDAIELAYFCPPCGAGVHDRIVAAVAGVIAAAR